MRLRCLSAIVMGAAALLPLRAETVLRVCADPNNLPFSNQRQEGFENRLAELVAAQMGARVEYTWWVERGSLAKNTVNAGRCDVLLGVPASFEDVETTAPYYRSTYVFVTRRDRNLEIRSLLDERLANLKIGVPVVGDDLAPPAYALAQRGITSNVTGFSLFGAYGEENPARRLVDAIANGQLDVGIAWGPIAGYFAQRATPALDVRPVLPPMFQGVPFVYDISMAVRKGNDTLRDALDHALEANRPAIRGLLNQYGMPQMQ